MKILEIIENPDESATLEMKFSKEEVERLVEYAVLSLLQKEIRDVEVEEDILTIK